MSRLKLLGQNIQKYRIKKGLNQQVLADYVVLSREYIADVERGHKSISLRKLFAIADALGVKISDLMNFD